MPFNLNELSSPSCVLTRFLQYQGELEVSNKVSFSGKKVVDIRHPSWCRHPRRQVGRHLFNQPRVANGSVRTDMRIMPAPALAGRSCNGRTLCGPRQSPTFSACALWHHHTPEDTHTKGRSFDFPDSVHDFLEPVVRDILNLKPASPQPPLCNRRYPDR